MEFDVGRGGIRRWQSGADGTGSHSARLQDREDRLRDRRATVRGRVADRREGCGQRLGVGVLSAAQHFLAGPVSTRRPAYITANRSATVEEPTDRA
jgi:hypothetical protein